MASTSLRFIATLAGSLEAGHALEVPWQHVLSSCRKCDGNGKIITDRCRKCNGEGRIENMRSVKVDIPPGVNNGVTMQVQGEGNIDRKRGIAGDLYLSFRVKEKPGVRRDGLNLYSNIYIDYIDAILGTVVQVETVDGYRDLRIPAGTQPGETFKMPNVGIPNMKRPSVRGDHHFTVGIRIPKKLSDTERSLVEKLALLRSPTKSQPVPSKEYNKPEYRSQRNESKEFKPSWWRGVFRRSQSRSGFAMINLQASLPTLVTHSRVKTHLAYICMIFIITKIFSYLIRIRSFRSIKRLDVSVNMLGKKHK